jgi:hypothetical protein
MVDQNIIKRIPWSIFEQYLETHKSTIVSAQSLVKEGVLPIQ